MNTLNGSTRTCGLIGNPVEHTLSPLIHNSLSEITGKNMIYVPFLVEPQNLEDAVKGAYALHLLGCNVTVPYKNQVIPFLKEVDDLAMRMGSVNTLVETDGGYKGYNTDMSGLLRAMQSDGVSIVDEDIIVLGAGGVGRAVVFMCIANGARNVYLLNRTREKAIQVAEEVNQSFGTKKVQAFALSEYEKLPQKKFIVMQCTSFGLYPNTEDVVIDDPNFYEKIEIGYDLIYNPWETKFMRLVKEHNGKAYNGLKMLLYQAIDAYEMWNHCTIRMEDANHIYDLMKEALHI